MSGVVGRVAGVVTTGELLGAGMSRARLRSLVRKGVLVPVGRGVYARASLAAALARDPVGEHTLRVAAALAVTGPGVVGSQHVTARRGVPVTSVARTVADLARTSSFRAGVVAADSALHRKLTSTAELQSVLTDCRGWSGIQRARRVLAFSDARSESAFESVSRVVFHDQGLPPPDLQAWVGDEDAVAGRVDFLWQAHRTIGEADGALKYRDPARAIAQLQRDARLRDAGFEVVHFTWDEIIRVPGQVTAALRAAFRRGGG